MSKGENVFANGNFIELMQDYNYMNKALKNLEETRQCEKEIERLNQSTISECRASVTCSRSFLFPNEC